MSVSSSGSSTRTRSRPRPRSKKRSIKKSEFLDLDLKVQRLYDRINKIEKQLDHVYIEKMFEKMFDEYIKKRKLQKEQKKEQEWKELVATHQMKRARSSVSDITQRLENL